MNINTAVSILFLSALVPATQVQAQLLPEPHQYIPGNIEEYEWEEQESNIPPYPKDENLLEFHVDSGDPRYRYYIDSDSVNINKSDGIVRYTLVLKLPGDHRSVSYEGMKCSSKEYKVYAFGGRNGEMKPTSRARWNPIRRSGSNLYRRDLWDFYLCNDQAIARRTEREILDALRYPRVDRKDIGFD